jgi:hypothetical protein
MELLRSIAEMDDIEIECPICDRSIPAVSKKCQFCGTALSMSGLDELEELAMHVDEITLGAESAQREKEKVPTSNDEISNIEELPARRVEVRYIRTEDADDKEKAPQPPETVELEASSEATTSSNDESESSEMSAREQKQTLKAEKREKRSQRKKEKREKKVRQKAAKRGAKDGKLTEKSSH